MKSKGEEVLEQRSRSLVGGLASVVAAIALTLAPWSGSSAHAYWAHRGPVAYVAPDGRPGAAGTIGDPVGSIAAARDLLAGKTSAVSPGTVYLRGGNYPVTDTTVLSGAADSNVDYTAYHGEKVVFSGTRDLPVSGFHKLDEVTGPQYSSASRLQATVKDQVYVFDLKAAGIPAGDIYKNGFNWQKQPFPPQLLVNDALQTLAQYPNGAATMSKADLATAVPSEGARDFFSDMSSSPKTYDQMLQMAGPVFNPVTSDVTSRYLGWGPPTQPGEPAANQPPRTDIDNTKYETDGWLAGYFGNNYANDRVQIYSVTSGGMDIHTKYPTMYRTQPSSLEVVAQNILSELDTAGEYYIDRWNGNDVLYYLPAGGTMDGKTVSLTSLDKPVFTLDHVSHVTFDGIHIDGTTSTGMNLFDCESCTVKNSEFSNISEDAIQIGQTNGEITALADFNTSDGGHHNVIENSSFHDLGGGGVFMAGGDRKTLERGDNIVTHNEFSNFSKLASYTPAVYMDGMGNTASYNYIHDAPHMVIQIMGNDMLITHNRIENVVQNASDMGAIYSGRDFSYLGNVISYNEFKNITGYLRYAIYLDDGMSAANIHHNVFDNITKAVFMNKGHAWSLTDNVYLNTGSMGWDSTFAAAGQFPIANSITMIDRWDDMMKPGDGTNYTNTQVNIDTWIRHYRSEYPNIAKLHIPSQADGTPCAAFDTGACSRDAVFTDPNSLYAASDITMARSVRIGSGDFSFKGVQVYNPGIDSDNVSFTTPDEVGYDPATGRFARTSPLETTANFGPRWLARWNAEFTLNGIGEQANG